eukprot:4145527-Pleurochrysis_carterae.AAC.2
MDYILYVWHKFRPFSKAFHFALQRSLRCLALLSLKPAAPCAVSRLLGAVRCPSPGRLSLAEGCAASRRLPPAALRAFDCWLRRAPSLTACCRWTPLIRAFARHSLRALSSPCSLRPLSLSALRCPSPFQRLILSEAPRPPPTLIHPIWRTWAPAAADLRAANALSRCVAKLATKSTTRFVSTQQIVWQCICEGMARNCTKQLLKGRARDRYQSFFHPGGRDTIYEYKYNESRVGSKRRSGGWGAPSRGLKKVAQGVAAAIVSEFSSARRAKRERSASTNATRV